MLAKVHLLAGDGASARCTTPTSAWRSASEHGLVDFDLAYAHEAGPERCTRWVATDEAATAWAAAKATPIADPEDRRSSRPTSPTGP